jgi:glutamate dehydrogenase
MAFRNEYHLRVDVTGDLFVPCGGRPESVNINNVARMFKKDGTPRFRFIVEGANLFITPDARRVLEDKGVVLVKDATANKGGVTSSSMEVLAALALPAEEHNKLMCIQPDGSVPQFYKDYVKQLTESIEEFARLEFEVCWREKQRDQSQYMFLISDLVSFKINKINDMMQASPLLDNDKFVKLVLAKSVPKKLQDHMGVDGVFARVPKAYVKAMCASYFASQYVYKYGLGGNEVDVLDFVQEFTRLVS